jgi:hypothetical protein
MCGGKERSGRRACLILLRQMFGCSIAVKIDIWCTEENDGEAVSLSKNTSSVMKVKVFKDISP